MKKKEDKKGSFDTVGKTLKFFFPTAWKKYPGYFIVSILRTIVNIAQPFVAIFTTPLLIDELLGGRKPELLILYAAILVIGSNGLLFLGFFLGMLQEKYDESLSMYVTELLSMRIMDMDFQLTEDKAALDQLEKAKNGISWYSGGVHGIATQFFGIIQNVVTIVGVVVIILLKAPLLLIAIVLLLAFGAFVNRKSDKLEIELYKQLSDHNRRFGYVGWTLADFRYGKDIRLYDAKDMMLEKLQQTIDTQMAQFKTFSNKQYRFGSIVTVAEVIKDIISYLYLGILVIYQRISIGGFSQLLSAGSTFSSGVEGLLSGMRSIVKRCSYAYEYVRFMEYPPAFEKGNKEVGSGEHEIEFRHVSFTYPNTTVKVLEDVNLKLKAGEHLSVVGLNGAGKTTMVKLLCRLYDPTDGEILLDGVNIKEYDYEQYMRLFTPVFQDFKLFAFSIKENISQDSESSDKEIQDILEACGIWDKVSSLEKGIHTMLFKSFDENGIEPSGGEQQKLAIARALYKKASVVILDEPTAALDPVAEYEIYRQFNTLVGNRTAIYISHRLSSCKFCDKIAVFSGGRVAEYGTHDELVRLPDGIYAEMFAAQAAYYQ